MFQPCQDDLFARLFNLACKKYFVKDSIDLDHPSANSASSRHRAQRFQSSTYLVEIEDQIQLAHVPKELVKDLHEEVYGLQIS
jgi:hypothetical protein